MAVKRAITVLLDASVPDAVGRKFQEHGHSVIFHRDALAEKTKDEVVCATALLNKAVLVAVDKDMKRIARFFGQKNVHDDRFAKLSLIFFSCGGVQAAARLDQSISLLEHEWAICAKRTARKLLVEIGDHYIRTNR